MSRKPDRRKKGGFSSRKRDPILGAATVLDQMAQDLFHLGRIGDDGKDAHRRTAGGTGERIDFVYFCKCGIDSLIDLARGAARVSGCPGPLRLPAAAASGADLLPRQNRQGIVRAARRFDSRSTPLPGACLPAWTSQCRYRTSRRIRADSAIGLPRRYPRDLPPASIPSVHSFARSHPALTVPPIPWPKGSW
jgi:hypothetical protein